MVHHGAGAGAAGGDPDTHVPYVGDDLGHGEEVRLVAEPPDDTELVVELVHRPAVPVETAGGHAALAPLPQQPHRPARPRLGPDHGRLGEVRNTEPQIPHRVHLARLRDGHGVGDQLHGARPAAPGGSRHPLGDLRHRGPALQPPLPAVEAPPVDGPQQPGRVQDVRDPVLGPVGVPYGVGQHGRDAEAVGERQGVRGQDVRDPVLGPVGVPYGVGQHGRDAEAVGERQGVRGQADRPRACAGQAPAHDLQPQPVADGLAPRCEELLGDVRAAGGERPQRLRHRTEQHHQPLTRVPAEHLPRSCQRCARGEGLGVRGGHEPAQPRPPGRVPGQERRPERRLRYVRAAAHRGTAAGLGRGHMGGDAEVDAEQRLHAGGRGGLREAHRTGDHVAVGQRHGADPALGRPRDEVMGMRGTVAGRKPTADMQVRDAFPHDTLRP